MQVRGKVVLITGASEGIGAACANAFQGRGARVSLTARSLAKLEKVGGADALVTPGDLTDASVRRRVVERTRERFGPIDILINNAGVGLYARTWEAPLPLVRRMFELNLFAALEMIQLVAPDMMRRKAGAIVNVSSIAGKVTLPWLTLYSASKYAVCSMSDGLRSELKPYGIQVTTVCPGYVRTGFADHALAGQQPLELVRHRKFAISAEECAEAIARAVERKARTVMAPPAGWVLVALERLFPSLVDWQLARINQTLERAG